MKQNSIKSVLVVDDSEDNQRLMRTLFEALGFQVYSALNGAEAIAVLVELPQLPQFILLDAQMPVMNGYEFRLRQMRNPRLADIPVIVISAEDDMEGKMLQPFAILTKPLRTGPLMACVRSLSI